MERWQRIAFVGREREQRLLANYLAGVPEDGGRVVLIAGEPGVGKTRLIDAFRRSAREAGATVLLGHAYESDGLPPYLPLVEALRDYTRAYGVDALRGHVSSEGTALLALLLPELQALPATVGDAVQQPEHERYRLFETVSDLLFAIARASDGGLVLILEDLHWADTSTLRLLQHIVRQLADAPLLIVISHRTVDLDRAHPLHDVLADLSRSSLVDRLPLRPFDHTQTAALVQELTANTPSAALVARLLDETGGNAFFLTELLRYVQSENLDIAARWSVPEGVRQVIGRRVARLDANATALLNAAAVLGDGCDFALLLAMIGLERSSALTALDACLLSGLLEQRDEGLHFAHALIRQTLYDDLSLPRRQALHLAAAAAIEQVYAHNPAAQAAALAYHYHAAGTAADPARCYAYARQAARAAEAVFAWDAAAAHWQMAVAIVDGGRLAPIDVEERLDLLLALAHALRRAGARGRAHAIFARVVQEAGAAGRPEYQAWAALGYAEHIGSGAVDITLLETALHALEGRDDALYARVLSRLLGTVDWGGSDAEREAQGAQAIAVARRVGDGDLLFQALLARFFLTADARTRLTIADEMTAIAAGLPNEELRLRAVHNYVRPLLELGRIAELDATIARYGQLAGQLRQPFFHHMHTVWHGMRALLDGRLAEAELLATEALQLGEQTQSPNAFHFYFEQIAYLRRLQGRNDEILALFEDARNYHTVQGTLITRALIFAWLGRLDEARALFEREAARQFADVPRCAVTMTALPARQADVCILLADRGRAEHLYALLLPYAGTLTPHFMGAVCEGAVDRRLAQLAALLGRWADAIAHYEAALRLHEQVGARVWLAQTRLEFAELLLSRPLHGATASVSTRTLLEQAAATYDDLALAQQAARARGLLGTVVATPSSRPMYPHGLSAREVEVLRLLAAGCSNRAIATALTISPNTVLQHVRSIFNKTGAANRAEAAAFAVRHHLDE